MIVSSPDEVTRERLEGEATLLTSVVRETECEAVTEREDTYEVIIDRDGERKTGRYTIGEWVHEDIDIIKEENLLQLGDWRTRLNLWSNIMRMTRNMLFSEDT